MNWKWKGQTIYPYDAFYRRASERFGKGSIGGGRCKTETSWTATIKRYSEEFRERS